MYDSESGKCSTLGLFQQRYNVNELAFSRWFMRHLSNTDRKTVLLEVGGVVNKPRLHVLIYPGKPLVCLCLEGNGEVAMLVFNLSTNS